MNTRKILIIDDEPGIRSIVSEILAPDGIEIAQAADATEALALVSANRDDPYSLVLCDISMPGRTGLDFLEELQLSDSYITPVIMLTAHTERARILEALRLGSLDYIVKPFDPIDFIERTRRGVEIGARRLAERAHYLDSPNERMVQKLRVFNKRKIGNT